MFKGCLKRGFALNFYAASLVSRVLELWEEKHHKKQTSEKETTEWVFRKKKNNKNRAAELYTHFLSNLIIGAGLAVAIQCQVASLSLLCSFPHPMVSNPLPSDGLNWVFFFLMAVICGQTAGFNSQNRVYTYCHFDYRIFVIISSR